jgi:flagellar hook-associated protein 2
MVNSTSSSVFDASRLSVDSSGRVSFSGATSGVDFKAIIDATVAARRQPAVQIENRIAKNTAKIAEFSALKSLTSGMTARLDKLRGSTSFFTADAFDKRLAFSSSQSSSDAPPSHTPSAAGNILGVSVASGATKGVHTVEVLQTAKAHRLSSDAITSTTATLSSLGITTGTLTIEGQAITLSASDTLADLADKINIANSGATPTGVAASVVSVSATENYLVLTSTKTGTANQITFDVPQTVADSLGLTNGAGGIKNEMQAAANAQIKVDGLPTTIERQSNTIDDVIDGLTINLFKAEENTEIVIEVADDLNSVKSDIVDFVQAFNEVRDFIIDQKTLRDRTPDDDEETESFGSLAFDAQFRQYAAALDEMLTFDNQGLTDGYQSLSQMGISLDSQNKMVINDTVFDDRLTKNIDQVRKFFAFELSTNDSRVSYIRNGANTTANAGGAPYYLTIQGTDANGDVLGATLRTGPGLGGTGASDGTVSINGNILTFTNATGAQELVIGFNGGASLGLISDIQLFPQRGFADSLYFMMDEYSKLGGLIDDTTTIAEVENETAQQRVDRIDEQLVRLRENLAIRYAGVEAALAQAEQLGTSILDAFQNAGKK